MSCAQCWLRTPTGILCPPIAGNPLVSSPVVVLSVGGVHLAEKALCEARLRTVRQLFALVNRHMRSELNDLARRLDNQTAAVALNENLVVAPASSASGLTPDGLRMLQAIGALPEDVPGGL